MPEAGNIPRLHYQFACRTVSSGRKVVVRFVQKSTISEDQSAILLWASDERPPVVARIRCESIHEITDQPECQKWADASPNIEILIEIACRLFTEGRYVNEQGIRVVEISGIDLTRERNRFRRVPNLRTGFMDRTGRF